jgi:filamentous hemagglutinin
LTGDGFGAKLNESIRKTSKIYDGQSVYRVTDDVGPYLKKGDQVYLDGDHKNHLEVFDRNGKSTFVMNLDGTMNAEKTQAAKGRTLK